MKRRIVLICCILLIVIFGCKKRSNNTLFENNIGELTMEEILFIEKQISYMDEIIKMHDTLKIIHISLEKLYPITVIHNDYFYIFDINELGNKYEFKLKMETPMPFTGNILAAFSLDFYDMKPSAVISNMILENQYNYVFIFHEFVHCFQLENGELDIRKGLSIERQEKAKNNFSWELNYPFPYSSEYFINKTIELSNFFANEDYDSVVNYHREMKLYLSETEFEYMVWQEWKEGFARYIENLIRNKLGLPINNNVLKPPFNRTHFYEIGSKYIEMLVNRNNVLDNNIIGLFNNMNITIGIN